MPRDVRRRVMQHVLEALELAVVVDESLPLDYFGRLELLELGLQDLHDTLNEQLPPVLEN